MYCYMIHVLLYDLCIDIQCIKNTCHVLLELYLNVKEFDLTVCETVCCHKKHCVNNK